MVYYFVYGKDFWKKVLNFDPSLLHSLYMFSKFLNAKPWFSFFFDDWIENMMEN